MGRYRRRMFENQEEGNSVDELYNLAYKRVKGSKGVHSLVEAAQVKCTTKDTDNFLSRYMSG
jgi:hypothetical protein